MEALLAMFLPVALLVIGLAILRGRSLSPAAVIGSIMVLLWRTLRWLWRDRRRRGSAGRTKRPPIRYRR